MKVSRLNSKKLAQRIVDTLDDLKGQSIRCINVKKLTEITDYMVITTGRSKTHTKALADAVANRLKKSGEKIVGIEGGLQSEWILVDAGDIVTLDGSGSMNTNGEITEYFWEQTSVTLG